MKAEAKGGKRMSGKLVYIDSVIQALDKAYGEGNL